MQVFGHKLKPIIFSTYNYIQNYTGARRTRATIGENNMVQINIKYENVNGNDQLNE